MLTTNMQNRHGDLLKAKLKPIRKRLTGTIGGKTWTGANVAALLTKAAAQPAPRSTNVRPSDASDEMRSMPTETLQDRVVVMPRTPVFSASELRAKADGRAALVELTKRARRTPVAGWRALR